MVDEVEAKAEPRSRAATEASGAEFGSVLVHVRDIDVKMSCDDVSCYPMRQLGPVSLGLLGHRVRMAGAPSWTCVGLGRRTSMSVCQATPFVRDALGTGITGDFAADASFASERASHSR